MTRRFRPVWRFFERNQIMKNQAQNSLKANKRAAAAPSPVVELDPVTMAPVEPVVETPAPAPVETAPAGETPAPAPAPANTAEKRSKGVAASWLDPEVRKARITHHGVLVSGVDPASNQRFENRPFKSVRAAFKALGLNDSKHIPFRAQVKAAGEGVFDGFDFVLAPAEVKPPKGKKAQAAAPAGETPAPVETAPAA
jgi:hypothetical protein